MATQLLMGYSFCLWVNINFLPNSQMVKPFLATDFMIFGYVKINPMKMAMTWSIRLSTLQCIRVRVPYSSTGTLSSVHISGTISTLIGSSTAHCSGAHVDYDHFSRL